MASTATGCLAEERSADVIIQIAKPVLQQKKLYLRWDLSRIFSANNMQCC